MNPAAALVLFALLASVAARRGPTPWPEWTLRTAPVYNRPRSASIEEFRR